jgi:hypothetical protein
LEQALAMLEATLGSNHPSATILHGDLQRVLLELEASDEPWGVSQTGEAAPRQRGDRIVLEQPEHSQGLTGVDGWRWAQLTTGLVQSRRTRRGRLRLLGLPTVDQLSREYRWTTTFRACSSPLLARATSSAAERSSPRAGVAS